jgi:hypothetical protein
MDLLKIYRYLSGLNTALIHSSEHGTIRDGSWQKYNHTIGELKSGLNDDYFKEYIVSIHSFKDRQSVDKGEFQRKVYSAAKYLHDQYSQVGDYTHTPEINNSNGDSSAPQAIAYQTQSSNQNTEVNIEFNSTLMQIAESLAKAEENHPESTSKENKFIKKLKSLLPAAKTTLEIMSLILKCAKEFGLDPSDAHKILGLS